MASLGGMWAPVAIRVLRHAVGGTVKMSKVLRTKLGSAAHKPINTQQISSAARHQPIHPFAFLRQQKRGLRWHASLRGGNYDLLRNAIRRFISDSSRAQPAQGGHTTRWVKQFTGRAPFASTLRPNLTGGAFPRTAGGYAIPGSGRVGGARYFSHAPPVQAQVVQNVSQAMRAFWLSGQRAHFDGNGPRGEKRYRVTTAIQDETARKAAAAKVSLRNVPGSFVDFSVSPTITALSPLAGAFPFSMQGVEKRNASTSATLNEDGLFDLLSVDFERALKDLSGVMEDLKRLSGLGDLPIMLENNSQIRVRFPGVDAETVTRLCEDLGVQRGIVGEDEDLESDLGGSTALRFPYAPGDLGDGASAPSSPHGSLRSHQSYSSGLSYMDEEYVEQFMEDNPWLSSASGEMEDFDGVEGIYRFIQECDRAEGRF